MAATHKSLLLAVSQRRLMITDLASRQKCDGGIPACSTGGGGATLSHAWSEISLAQEVYIDVQMCPSVSLSKQALRNAMHSIHHGCWDQLGPNSLKLADATA